MSRSIFYHSTIKNIIVVFGSLFDDIKFINDEDTEITVPIHYSPKEKFVAYFTEEPDLNSQNIERVLPRLGFEMIGLNFASERFLNPLNKMVDTDTNNIGKFVYSRIPYDFQFNLYLATNKFEESLKIVEQIVPFFTPELNVTIKDMSPNFDFSTDVTAILNSTGYQIDYEGDFTSKRTIMWTLGFTLKSWLYGDIKQRVAIQKVIVNLTRENIDEKFKILIEEV